MASFNFLDLGIAAVILLSAVIAYSRGFVRSFLYLTAWIGAVLATYFGYPILKPYVRSVISNELLADISTGVAIFVATLIVLSILSQAMGRLVQDSVLNMLDRSLGFLFGILRGVVLICLVYLGIEQAMPPERQPQWLRSARSIPLIEVGVGLMKSFIPGETKGAGTGRIRKAGDEAQKLFDSEARTTFDKMLTPDAKQPTAAPPRQGYSDQERREIDRLIDGNQ